MALETATYISGLVAVNPLSTDPKSQGDDHLRLIKSVLLNSFPGVAGAVTATHTELSYVAGVTSGIQAQLNAITAQLSGGSSIALNSVAAATATATIGNGANQINWNWTLTGATGRGFNVSETTASTSGAGSQDLVRIGTLNNSTANPLRVFVAGNSAPALAVNRDGSIAIAPVSVSGAAGLTLTGSVNAGAVSIAGGNATGGGQTGGAVTITGGGGSSTNNAGPVNIAGGASTSGTGGDIVLTPGTGGAGGGRINFVNSSVANGTVASAFTASVGPTGASTSIVGWLAIKVGGTARYIPYW